MPFDTGMYLTWRVMPANRKRNCRWAEGHPLKYCQAPAVAELNRGIKREIWWAYCSEHMWGRTIVNGKVVEV